MLVIVDKSSNRLGPRDYTKNELCSKSCRKIKEGFGTWYWIFCIHK